MHVLPPSQPRAQQCSCKLLRTVGASPVRPPCSALPRTRPATHPSTDPPPPHTHTPPTDHRTKLNFDLNKVMEGGIDDSIQVRFMRASSLPLPRPPTRRLGVLSRVVALAPAPPHTLPCAAPPSHAGPDPAGPAGGAEGARRRRPGDACMRRRAYRQRPTCRRSPPRRRDGREGEHALPASAWCRLCNPLGCTQSRQHCRPKGSAKKAGRERATLAQKVRTHPQLALHSFTHRRSDPTPPSEALPSPERAGRRGSGLGGRGRMTRLARGGAPCSPPAQSSFIALLPPLPCVQAPQANGRPAQLFARCAELASFHTRHCARELAPPAGLHHQPPQSVWLGRSGGGWDALNARPELATVRRRVGGRHRSATQLLPPPQALPMAASLRLLVLAALVLAARAE